MKKKLIIRKYKVLPVLCVLAFFMLGVNIVPRESEPEEKPRISFTFDDGITRDIGPYKFEDWNAMILSTLDSSDLCAVFFVTGENKTDEKGRYLLKSWNDGGHKIANHTYTHKNYNAVSYEEFKLEFLRTDSLIRHYSNFIPLFRFPYLKEGDTREKIDSFRELMKTNGYRNGYVTIDASDWYIESRLEKSIAASGTEHVDDYKQFYLDHIYERAMYYEGISHELTGRYISHTLLLHHNLVSALFLDDLIRMFQERGWEVMNADQAYTDVIFNEMPTNVPAGESLVWAMAKQSGKYEGKLRYPAEDSRYEKGKMDSLGLK